MLNRSEYRELHNLLRLVTCERRSVASVMVFCIRHAASASIIVETIIESICISSTPFMPNKLARLYVVNDLLHNSAGNTPNAWQFRDEFQKKLPAVMHHLGTIMDSIPGRLKAYQFRATIARFLAVWRDKKYFQESYIQRLYDELDHVNSSESIQTGRGQGPAESPFEPKTASYSVLDDFVEFKSRFTPISQPKVVSSFEHAIKIPDTQTTAQTEGQNEQQTLDGSSVPEGYMPYYTIQDELTSIRCLFVHAEETETSLQERALLTALDITEEMNSPIIEEQIEQSTSMSTNEGMRAMQGTLPKDVQSVAGKNSADNKSELIKNKFSLIDLVDDGYDMFS